MATVNWAQTGLVGITHAGWMIMPCKRPGMDGNWHVFDADGLFIGEYDTRAEAEAAAR
jgi:hypothetical protein